MLYKKSTTELYVRASSIQINNGLGHTPDITFFEQFATVDGVSLDGLRSSCALSMDDPSTAFELVHPETDEVLGSMTYAELQLALYSLYLKAATERDVAEIPLPEEPAIPGDEYVFEEVTDGPAD